MRKVLLLILSVLILYTLLLFRQPHPPLQVSKPSPIQLIDRDDRLLILAPHPDDETIGCAGVIQQALAAKAQVRVVYLTNGDHNELAFMVYEKRLTLRKAEFIHMGQVRRNEAIKAMSLLGLGENNLIFLGYPDNGTFAIFSQYWQTEKPYKSILTRISSVPNKENFSFGSAYVGENILRDLKKVLKAYRPNKIFVSHPLDTNVDHRAFYLFLEVALRDLSKEITHPKIYPYLVHCVRWPLPRNYHPELSLDPPKQMLDAQINWLKVPLTQSQIDRKYQAIMASKSQTQSSAFYLKSFVRKNELFGDCPDIELNKQFSLKEKAVSFFGFSKMYADSDTELFGGLDNLIEHKGRVSYAVVDNSLLICVEKEKDFNRAFGLLFYLFGYSSKTPFAQMPKISIITKRNKFKVFDGRKMIKPEGISIQLSSNSLILKVPLEVLGSPDFILTSLKAYAGFLPVDTIGFRKIVIK